MQTLRFEEKIKNKFSHKKRLKVTLLIIRKRAENILAGFHPPVIRKRASKRKQETDIIKLSDLQLMSI